MADRFDVVVVGARCAGSPLATLLAREDVRVALVERAKFPRDTLSTHIFEAPGINVLGRLGVLNRVRATGAEPIRHLDFRQDEFATRVERRCDRGTLAAPCRYAGSCSIRFWPRRRGMPRQGDDGDERDGSDAERPGDRSAGQVSPASFFLGDEFVWIGRVPRPKECLMARPPMFSVQEKQRIVLSVWAGTCSQSAVSGAAARPGSSSMPRSVHLAKMRGGKEVEFFNYVSADEWAEAWSG